MEVRSLPRCTQIPMCVQHDTTCIGFLVTVKPVFLWSLKIDQKPDQYY